MLVSATSIDTDDSITRYNFYGRDKNVLTQKCLEFKISNDERW